VHVGERFSVSFQRTDRLAQATLTDRPVSRGQLPARLTSDLLTSFDSNESTAVVVPCDVTEAVWLGFAGASSRRVALKIRQGDVNAVTGTNWDELLHEPQDYLVPPDQTAWYGVASGDGHGRQFSTDPIELLIFEPETAGDLAPRRANWEAPFYGLGDSRRQTEIFNIVPDPHGPTFWSSEPAACVTIYFVDSERWKTLTGEAPPNPSEGYRGALLP
jgi:hypothetical protein